MSRHHEPTPADILRDTSELAGDLYCILANTEASPLGPMHGTSDPVRTMAWDLACASMRHLTEHDPAALLAEEIEDAERGDFCAAYKSQLAA